MRTLIIAVAVLAGCSRISPCETSGGQCTDPGQQCAANAVFTGFDPACEPQSKCCRPVDGGAPPPPPKVVDAGPPPSSGRSCFLGLCRHQCLPGELEYDGQINGSCPINEVCCKK